MRIFPLLTAAAVVAALYFIVLERDLLMSFATNGPDSEQEAPAASVPAEETQQRVAVVAEHVERQPVSRTVVLRGRTEAARRVEVNAQTTGRVISEPLPAGTHVEAGDVLCKLAPGTSEAALAEAEARLSEAELNFRAATRLSAEGYAAQTRLAEARAARQAAEAAVERAREQIDRLTMTAPFDGVLEDESAELGTLLQAGAPGGALCATLYKLDPIKLVGFAPEAQVDRLAVGAPAVARLSTDRRLQGTVSFVARSADPSTRTFRVEITADNAELDVRAGQSAEIVISATDTEGHLVRGSAMTLNDEGRVGLRIVGEDARARFVPVEVLRDTRDGIWVSGLPETARVIVVGQEYVREGTPLSVTMQEPPRPSGQPAGEQALPIAPDGAGARLEAPATPDLGVTQ